MIQIYGLSKTYPGGIRALEGVSFSVNKGEFVFVTGPSGAGKTTLLRLILLAEKPDRGEIIFEGVNITRLARLGRKAIYQFRRKIGFVFQDFKLIPHLTVFENVALPLEISGYPLKKVKKRVEQALRLVGLDNKLFDQLPPTLSGGEQQRVAIARAIVSNPPLIIADEPTGNLDPDLTVEIMNLFDKINLTGTTLIVATHDRSIIERYRKRTIFLHKGRIVGDERL